MVKILSKLRETLETPTTTAENEPKDLKKSGPDMSMNIVRKVRDLLRGKR